MPKDDRIAGAPALLPLDPVRGAPARPLDAEASRRIVDVALDDALGTPAAPRRAWLVAAAALLVCVTGTATAVAWIYRAELFPAREPATLRHAPRRAHRAPPAPEPATEAPQSSAPVVATPAPEVQAPEGAPRPSSAHRHHAARGASSTADQTDILRTANTLRAARRWREAERAYADVARRFAGSDEAYTATIAAASLRVDHLGDPRGALTAFRRALAARPSGDLSEEARYGIAQCHRALGDASAERRALEELLVRHPRTALRRRVEARLSELRGTR